LLDALILGLTPQAKYLSPLRGLVWNLPLRSPTGEAGSPLRGSGLNEIREQVLLIVGTSSSQAPEAQHIHSLGREPQGKDDKNQ